MSASTGTTVVVLVVALVLLGVAMIGVAVWLVRATRSDPPALGPLEVMGARRWRRGDADRRQTKLDTARPTGAPPPAPIVAFEPADGEAASAAAAAAPVASTANCEPSMQESAVSAHTSPVEPADAAPEAGGDGDVVADGPGNCEPSMQESAVSAHTSPEEPTNSESEVEANTKE